MIFFFKDRRTTVYDLYSTRIIIYSMPLLSTFSRSIKRSSGALSYSSSLVTANTTGAAVDVPPPPLTVCSSHPNRFLMESIRSTSKRPLELSTDSVTLEALSGGGGGGCPARSMVRCRHDSAIKQRRRRPLRRTFHTVPQSSSSYDRPSSFEDS